MKTRRLLLLDDDALAAAVLADSFRSLGWEVHACSRPAELLHRLAHDRPDAVLLDFVLPDTDGAALCAAIRLAPGARLPVLLFSGSDVDPELARAAGADGMFPKPVPVEQVHQRLLALLRRDEGDEGDSPRPAGAVRLPAGDVLGVDAHAGGVAEEGELSPGWLPSVLLRIHDRQFTGVLEISTDNWRCKVFFNRANPASARSTDHETELGAVLGKLGLATRDRLESSAAEARRRGRPLGEELVASSLIDRPAAERALREQVLQRLERAGKEAAGRWILSPAEPLGLAGYEVPAAVAFWRAGGSVDLTFDDADRGAHIRPALPVWAWTLLDPAGVHTATRKAIVTGARLSDCLSAGGTVASRLVAILRRFGNLSLAEDPPAVAPDASTHSETELIEARVAANARRLAEADHYTVLGLAPDASDFEVSAALLTAVAATHPDTLPGDVSAATRERARRHFAAVVEAGRVLGDTERRAIYDAELNRRERRGVHAPRGEAHADLLAERAREAFLRGQHATSAALLRAALRLEGDNADVLAMLGMARHLACPGDPDAGLKELKQAIDLDAHAEYAKFWLAQIHVARGEPEAARTLLRQALEANQDFDPARDALRSLEP